MVGYGHNLCVPFSPYRPLRTAYKKGWLDLVNETTAGESSDIPLHPAFVAADLCNSRELHCARLGPSGEAVFPEQREINDSSKG